MLFSSPQFIVFFAVYFLLHRLLPPGWRLALIIAGGTVFYAAWNPFYVWVPYLLLVTGYFGAIWMMTGASPAARRSRLWVILWALLAPLLVVKYTDFVFADILGPLFGSGGKVLGMALPLGISFITFTMIAYVVDVYRERIPVVRRAGLLAGLVLFFPHLIAGPILRPNDLVPQLSRARSHARKGRVFFVYGLTTFSFGLFKKLVIADQIAPYVERVFDGNGIGLDKFGYLLGIYGYAVQIYCDFSGYTDMAIGAALMLGIRLPVNFMSPYSAASVADFWRRWHMTLSRWLRDYLYIPLGGNRRGRGRETANILVTMALGGLWHGANWTFVLWGLFHGAGVVAGHLFRSVSAGWPVPRFLGVLATFHFVCVGWILFRSADLGTAIRVASGPFAAPAGEWKAQLGAGAFPLLLLGIFIAIHPWDNQRTIRRLVHAAPIAVLVPALLFLWGLSIAVSAGGSGKFIYFDF